MKLIIAACAVLAVAGPALAQQTGVGGAPPTPGSAPSATSDQPLSDPIQQPGGTETLLPDPDTGLSEPVSPDTLGSGAAAQQASPDQEGADQQRENVAGDGIELPPPSMKIAGPGDVVPKVTRNEEDVSTVLGKARRTGGS